jgi:hypothetical protein
MARFHCSKALEQCFQKLGRTCSKGLEPWFQIHLFCFIHFINFKRLEPHFQRFGTTFPKGLNIYVVWLQRLKRTWFQRLGTMAPNTFTVRICRYAGLRGTAQFQNTLAIVATLFSCFFAHIHDVLCMLYTESLKVAMLSCKYVIIIG